MQSSQNLNGELESAYEALREALVQDSEQHRGIKDSYLQEYAMNRKDNQEDFGQKLADQVPLKEKKERIVMELCYQMKLHQRDKPLLHEEIQEIQKKEGELVKHNPTIINILNERRAGGKIYEALRKFLIVCRLISRNKQRPASAKVATRLNVFQQANKADTQETNVDEIKPRSRLGSTASSRSGRTT